MNSIAKFLIYSFCQTRQPIVILEKDLIWKQITGGGPGGQKINKTSNCVQLTHGPTGIVIKCQKSRNLETNKYRYAYKFLKEKLDEMINGELSKKNQEIEKKRKQKLRRQRRSKQKYENTNENENDIDE